MSTSVILVDASWDSTKNSGWGASVYDQEGNLAKTWAGFMQVEDSLHGETLAMLAILQRYKAGANGAPTSKVVFFQIVKCWYKQSPIALSVAYHPGKQHTQQLNAYN